MAYEGLQFPTSPTTTALYSWSLNFVTQLRQIMTDLNTAVPDLDALTTDIDDLQSRVTILEASGGGALTPQQVAELDLVTAVDSKIGSVAELNKRIKTQLEYQADAIMHAAIEAHRGTTGVRTQVSVTQGLSENIAGVAANLVTVSDDLTDQIDAVNASLTTQMASVATQINSVTANLGVTNSNVTSLQATVATGDAALAANISTLSTQVAGNTSSITSQQTSINGIYASSTIAVSIGGRVVGTQTISGTPLASFFDVDVDYFRIGSASYSNKPVFQIGTKNGVADIVFHGNLIGDGTITANALAANSVTAAKIAAGTITADKLSVSSLSAINANLGTVTAGTIQNPAGTLIDDLANLRRYRSDGTMTLDFSAKFFEMIF